jgi:hypothetical protein
VEQRDNSGEPTAVIAVAAVAIACSFSVMSKSGTGCRLAFRLPPHCHDSPQG